MTKIFKFAIFCAFVFMLGMGCAKREDINNLSTLGDVIDIKKEIEIDLGTLEDNYVLDYKLEGVGEKVIKDIVRSCGCVGPGLNKGEKWDFGHHPFTIQVSLAGKQAGEGVQDFLISFTDGTAVRIMVKYTYLPLPSCTPDSIIFKKDETEKTLTFSFDGEKNVSIEKIEMPSFFSYEQLTKFSGSSLTIEVRLCLERESVVNEKEGVIKIGTSSKRKPHFVIPYLVLFH